MSLGAFSRLVALPHSVFALPFALAAFLLSFRRGALVEPSFSLLGELIVMVLAVVAARTAAMGWNRLADADIDALNPRTAKREIPAGAVSRRQAAILVGGSSAAFFLCAFLLGTHCLVLAPLVLGLLFYYSATKRRGAHAHIVLGLALALAPGGAWWIFRPAVELTPLLLMFSVLAWVAGFDILYSGQDVEFDRSQGIFSIPAEVGIEYSHFLARVLHLLCVVGFLAVGWSAGLNGWYEVGVLVVAGSLVLEHRMVSPFDLSRINHAFFTMNGVVSVAYFLFVALSIMTEGEGTPHAYSGSNPRSAAMLALVSPLASSESSLAYIPR